MNIAGASAQLFPFDNSYARLPDRFYARHLPTVVAAPRLIRLNIALARELGLDPEKLATQEGVEMLAGNRIAENSVPLATAYAGHQFGSFVPKLGDGRAILLGEIIGRDGIRRDVQLKGSGPTPFSRRGDGRAGLGPVLREYIISEAMAALGIPTTRSLAAVATGETIMREMPLPGAVLTRIASSHIRVGTFQYFAAREDTEALRQLSEHVIARHYPEAGRAGNPVRAMLDAIIARQADLIVKWMLVGFIHGVMNTDNMSIAGETIDYGPCAFMDFYHPGTVYSSIDEMGRYAYGNQPHIAQWNLARLAEALLPLLGKTRDAAIIEAQAALDGFATRFEFAYAQGFARKLGFGNVGPDEITLVTDLLSLMDAEGADFTLTFHRLCDSTDGPQNDAVLRAGLSDAVGIDAWLETWRTRLAQDGMAATTRRAMMRAANPAFIPRNHLVEEALAAANDGDFSPFETLLEVLSRPFEDRPEYAAYAAPPRPDQIVQQTFCGT